jgi:hypothetical protein
MTLGILDNSLGVQVVALNKSGVDLRLSHFLGVHSLQVIPFLGYQLRNQLNGIPFIFLSSVIYLALFLILFLNAFIR